MWSVEIICGKSMIVTCSSSLISRLNSLKSQWISPNDASRLRGRAARECTQFSGCAQLSCLGRGASGLQGVRPVGCGLLGRPAGRGAG
eukprot:6923795-Prymnesium_polylepis.1